jgi:hypothetical protein
MTEETIEEEIQINGSRKIVLGVRCFPELKNKLSQEATDLGITLSEHTENILLNKDNSLDEKVILENNIFLLEDEFSKLKNQSFSENNQFRSEINDLKNAINGKQEALLKMQNQLNKLIMVNTNLKFFEENYEKLLNDPRLDKLFKGLKEPKFECINDDGIKFSIVCNTKYDLLKALIYSFKLRDDLFLF